MWTTCLERYLPTWLVLTNYHPIRVVEQGNYHVIVVVECSGVQYPIYQCCLFRTEYQSILYYETYHMIVCKITW